jgi:large subunit ribosomal protein L19
VAARSGAVEDFRAGDVLEVTMRVPEANGAEYVFRGLCIARMNKGIRSAFKLYNVYAESGGVVQHIPLHMPDLRSVRVVGRLPRVRRSKLYYLLEGDRGASYQKAPVQAAVLKAAAEAAASKAAGGGGNKAAGGKVKKGKKAKKG